MPLNVYEEKVSYKFVSGKVSIPAGKTFKIETTPDGEDELEFTPPPGETYQASVYIRFTKIE